MSFITLEGGEGVGKSTHARQLAEALRSRGVEVVLTREPGGTPGAEAIRSLLTTGEIDRWSARTEVLLFAAARADHVERVIAPALERGMWVVCDRFVDSTRAYQSVGGAMSDPAIMMVHRIGTGGLLPDRTLLLTVDEATAAARTARRERGDRIEDRDRAFHASVRAAFEELVEREPARWRRIDAAGETASVATQVFAAIADLL